MTDYHALVLLLLAVAIVIAMSVGNFVAWAREEWRLIRCKTWQGEYVVNPALGSASDDRVAAMVVKQRSFGKRLRRQGRTLLAGKEYQPVLTKAVEPPTPAPRADRVVPIRRPQKIA